MSITEILLEQRVVTSSWFSNEVEVREEFHRSIHLHPMSGRISESPGQAIFVQVTLRTTGVPVKAQ